MKRLFVIRHAKSSWDYHQLKDIERPLNSRGIADAPRIGRYLYNKAHKVDLFISSPAVRAKTTCEIISNELKSVGRIIIEEKLFHASIHEISSVIKNINNVSSAAIFGHNPGLTDFANEITGSQIDNIPTCGVAIIDINISEWNAFGSVKGTLHDFIFPKNL